MTPWELFLWGIALNVVIFSVGFTLFVTLAMISVPFERLLRDRSADAKEKTRDR